MGFGRKSKDTSEQKKESENVAAVHVLFFLNMNMDFILFLIGG